ncbi:MAG: methyltransferase domain-containing protein [bacterium]|nr:methyltransferase domain-containing protein [bacterium]
MRVVDLDRDMSDVIPTGMSPDSEFLFARMTEATLHATCADPGRLVLDVASGFGQDSISLARGGARVIGAEPSQRMTAMAQLLGGEDLEQGDLAPDWVRGWADALPFEDASFDATFCKGAMDHFDDPEAAIAEMARVTKRDGRVVLAIANFDSLACRVTRAIDEFREDWLGWGPMRGRRGYDTPSDHFTRYELDLMKEQAARYVEIERVQGVSIGWGLPGWATLACLLPRPLVDPILRGLDALARQFPTLADVIVVVGRPRLDRSTSSP